METTINISKSRNNRIVRISRAVDGLTENRAYFSHPARSECHAVAEALRINIARHGDDVIAFADYPVIFRWTEAGRTIWE